MQASMTTDTMSDPKLHLCQSIRCLLEFVGRVVGGTGWCLLSLRQQGPGATRELFPCFLLHLACFRNASHVDPPGRSTPGWEPRKPPCRHASLAMLLVHTMQQERAVIALSTRRGPRRQTSRAAEELDEVEEDEVEEDEDEDEDEDEEDEEEEKDDDDPELAHSFVDADDVELDLLFAWAGAALRPANARRLPHR